MQHADESDSEDEFIESNLYNNLDFSMKAISHEEKILDELIPNSLIISQRNMLDKQGSSKNKNFVMASEYSP